MTIDAAVAAAEITVEATTRAAWIAGTAAGLTLAGVLITAWVTLRNQTRTSFAATITTERAQWRQDIRTAVTDLAALVAKARDDRSFDPAEFALLRTAIRLRLNPSLHQRHCRDQAISLRLEEIGEALRAEPMRGNDAKAKFSAFEREVRWLLKDEWEKSKAEAENRKLPAATPCPAPPTP